MTELIMQAYNVLDEFKEHPFYLEMQILNKQIEEKYPELIKQFAKAKAIYDEILNTGGNHHPDYKKATLELSTIKTELYAKIEVQRYFELEHNFQALINSFLKEMANSISPHIETPNSFNLLKKKNHHGGNHGN